MSNDTINVQRGIVGAGSDDDTYVLSASLIDDNAQITITDVEGANKIQLIGGLTIASSIVAGDTAQLTLSNGAVITVLGASSMSYEVGGNPLTGTAGVTKDYATFAVDTLGTTVPADGEANSTGGASTVNEDGTATGGSATYTLTAGATSVDEGATATFALATTDVAEGTEVAYTISGVDAADVDGGSLTGTATIAADGTATISVALVADITTEGAETLTVTIDGQTATASSTVNDTSLTSTFAELETAYNTARAAVVAAAVDTSTLELAQAYETAAQAAVTAAAALTAAATEAADIATATAATNESAVSLELAQTAVYDETLADYNAAVTVAEASDAAADTAATTVSSVALANASLTAANTAKTDADAVVALATALVTAAANTPSIADDAVAASANTSAASAQTTAATLVTVATAAVATAQAAEDAAASVGDSAALTTSDDNVFGSEKSDTYTGTQTTYNANDVIVDSSSIDSDSLTITATADITETATVVGIESLNFNLDAVLAGDTQFDVAADNISASTINVAVTKAGSTVVSAGITNVKSGITVATDLVTAAVSTVADADVTVNMTGATAALTQTGTTDTLTVASTGALTLTTTAEEAVTVNAESTVSITDAAANAAATAVAYTINAKGAVDIVDITDTGTLSVTTTTGNVTVGATDLHMTGDVTLSSAAGNVIVTDAADMAAGSTLTATAVGDADAQSDSGANTTADGDITVTSTTARALVLSATGDINLDAAENATAITLTAGQDSAIANTVSNVQTLTLESNKSSGAAVKFTVAVGDGGAGGDEANEGIEQLDNIVFTGSNNVTLVLDGTDLVLAAASTDNSTTAAALIATDNSTATSRIALSDGAGASLDLSKLAVDEIAFNADALAAGDAYTVASGANVVIAGDLTANDLELTAAAVAGNTVSITIEDDSTSSSVYDVNALTVSNIDTINLHANDTDTVTDIQIGATAVGAGGTLVIDGATDIDFTSTLTGKALSGSAATGDITIASVNATTTYTTGSGADSFTSTSAQGLTITSGSGTDTLELSNHDYSAQTISLNGVDVINSGGTTTELAGALLNGSDYVIGGTTSILITAQTGTGEVVDLSNTSSSITVTLSGNTGGDALTGSSTTATTITGLAGIDVITGGAAIDTITGGADNDTLTGGGEDDVFIYASATDGIDTYTDFDFGASGDDLQLTITAAVADIASNAAAVTTGVDGGAVAVATIAADTAIDAASTSEMYVFASGGTDSLTGVTATSTSAAIVAEAIVQLNDGTATFANGNVANEGGMVLMTNDTDYFMFIVKNDDTSATTETADISLVGIFSGLDAANVHADNFA